MNNSYSKLPDLGVWHIVGINGIGMSGIARMLKAIGCKVQGSDLGISPSTKLLEADGIKVWVGHDAANIVGANIVVRSTAVKDHNPEIIAARSSDITVLSRAQILQMLLRNKRNILVTGAHGKTTTTAMVAHILIESNIDPNVLLGGNVASLKGSNYRNGSSSICVVEADESDGTFVKLPMHIGIITNMDADHIDYYQNFDNLLAHYVQFMRNVPLDGVLVINADDEKTQVCLKEKDIIGKVMTYSVNNNEADFKVSNCLIESGMQRFELTFSKRACEYFNLSYSTHVFSLKVFGSYNVANATAAIISALASGLSIKEIESALSSFTSVDRRFTKIGEVEGAIFIDDYAHHPTEIKAVLEVAISLLKINKEEKGKVIAVLQPHRFSRVKDFFNDFVCCCAKADIILLLDVYGAGEEAIPGIDANVLTDAMLTKGLPVVYVESQKQLQDKLADIIESGDYVIFLGAGDISKRAYEIFEAFKPISL